MSTTEVTKIVSLTNTTSYSFSHIISDPAHEIPSSSLWIDQFLQTNQIWLLRVRSNHPCSETVIAELNLKIENPPLYEGLNWDYKDCNVQLINHGIESLNWEKPFEGKNASYANEKYYL